MKKMESENKIKNSPELLDQRKEEMKATVETIRELISQHKTQPIAKSRTSSGRNSKIRILRTCG
jgi:hypothetical protein